MLSNRFLARALVLALLIATILAVFLVGTAGALAEGVPTHDAPAIVNIFDTAQLIALIAGVVIPFVVALLARPNASGTVKAILATLAAGLTALATYLGNVDGSHTWKGAVSVFVVAVVVAAASRVTLTGHKVDQVLGGTPGVVG